MCTCRTRFQFHPLISPSLFPLPPAFTEKGGPITNLPIHVSTLSGNLGEVKRLITDRPGLVHKRGLYLRTPLLCAASRGHFEVRENQK